MRDREKASFDIRRWWFVPFALLLVVLFFRARPAGYITTAPLSTVADVTTVAAVAPTSAPAEPSASAIITAASGTIVAEDASASAAPLTAEPLTTTPAVVPTVVLPTPTAEPPALAPEVAPPTAPTNAPAQPTLVPPAGQAAPPTEAAPAPNVEATQRFPVRLRIPAIDLDLEPIAVGLDGNRIPVVPKHDAGWYAASAVPGGGSNVVFWGHVLRWLDSPDIAAPFARVQELQPGATVEISLANGEQYTYRVTQQIQARPEDVQYILPTDGERVTLVSCVGDKVIREGVLTKEFRLITIAEPL